MDNLASTRAVDPVLTTIARGYRNAAYAFETLFPIVPVTARGGKIIQFGAEDFAKRNIIRAPGGRRERLDIGYAGDDYALEQRALDGILPRERLQEAAAVPGIRLGRVTLNKTMSAVFLQIEVAAATLATTIENYSSAHTAALAGDNQWDNAASKPARRVKQAFQVIAGKVGMHPNTLVVGPEVHLALTENPDVLDRVKHVTGLENPQVTEMHLANYFGVEHYAVGLARSGDAGDFSAIWGKNAVLAYVARSSLAEAEMDMGEPSFGYCYRLENYPMVEEAWFDRSNDSWIYPVTCEDKPVIAGKDAAYLFSSVIE